jgi:MFS family permease
MMNIAIASIITAPLSGFILSFSDWRWLFIIEGLFPFVVAAPMWWLMVADRPSQAKWCSPEEREYIETSLEADRAASPQEHRGLRDVVTSSVVLRLTAVYFLIQIGFYGLNTWLPTVVEHITGGAIWQVGLVTAIPYVAAMIGLWFNAKAADRSGRYSTYVFLAMLVGAVTLVISVWVGTAVPVLAIALISIAMGGALAYDGPFWASASRAVPIAIAGAAMGFINALGNLGGFVGPYVGGWLQDVSGSFRSTSIFLALCLVGAGLVMLTLRKRGDRPVEQAQPADDVATRRPA